MNISIEQLIGRDDSALVSLGQAQIHVAVLDDWSALCRDAKAAGFELAIASAHRSYERQLTIWNAKATGQREVLDRQEQAIDISRLDNAEKLQVLLYWSAIPGCSRHHWGTDIDVYDRAAVEPAYQLQLTAAEASGVFAPLHEWLDDRIASDRAYQFYRPYCGQSGVAAEPWHLIYRD